LQNLAVYKDMIAVKITRKNNSLFHTYHSSWKLNVCRIYIC